MHWKRKSHTHLTPVWLGVHAQGNLGEHGGEGVGMARHVDFKDHKDAALSKSNPSREYTHVARILHHLLHVPMRVHHARPVCGVLRQVWIRVHGERPALCIDRVPVKHVELARGHGVQGPLDVGHGEEVAGGVEQHSAIRELWRILYGDGRVCNVGCAASCSRVHELSERLERTQGPDGRGGGDGARGATDGQGVGLVRGQVDISVDRLGDVNGDRGERVILFGIEGRSGFERPDKGGRGNLDLEASNSVGEERVRAGADVEGEARVDNEGGGAGVEGCRKRPNGSGRGRAKGQDGVDDEEVHFSKKREAVRVPNTCNLRSADNLAIYVDRGRLSLTFAHVMAHVMAAWLPNLATL
ncbi:hypothetical protein BC937DRAFT_90555 [Endogone sp. FLAS-F59071]|nr:hypothetical protein BC937DRAFT_90555 [Endogone sp. FLAS-F59071]|eukprot:RUS22058.1 hypothetical protein BC937DRAFT_90555 [Endogone sp. FLAS-F59071]